MKHIRVGREPDNDIVINNKRLSRRHAQFILDDQGLWLEDLGSTNGTMLNSKRIENRRRVKLTDDVVFGDVVFDMSRLPSYLPELRPPPPQSQAPPPSPPPRSTSQSVSPPSRPPSQKAMPTPITNNEQVDPSIPQQRRTIDTPGVVVQAGTSPKEVLAAVESQKSYVGKAVLTLAIYMVIWIVGIILNFVYLGEANKTKRIVGTSPSGHGCLVTLIWLFFYIPLTIIVFLAIFAHDVLSDFFTAFFQVYMNLLR